jgi:ATP-dependent Clp protease ATP-binding subunit ClpC
VYQWYRGELAVLEPTVGSDRFDETVSADMLAHLPARLTPRALARAVLQTQGGMFFVARFGLSPQFVAELVTDDEADAPAVIAAAKNIAQQAGGTLDGAAITAALVQTSPRIAALLPHLQLDMEDLVAGVSWYARLLQLIDWQRRPRKNGGIGRDWSFGYTPTLGRYGINISEQLSHGAVPHVHLESHAAAIDFMTDTFGSRGRQNVAIIGPLGSGKTTLLYAFADLLLQADSSLPGSLKYRQIVSLSASSLIAAAPGRGDLERLINSVLIEAYDAKNIILCLDDAQLFCEEGVGSVDVSSLLLPVLEGGALKLLLTMDEQSWLRISTRNPALAAALNRTIITPATHAETMRVMQDQIISTEFQHKVMYMYQALKEAYRLGDRYMYDRAMPGKAAGLLEAAAAYADGGVVSASSVQKAIEQTMGVKVAAVVDDSEERQKLLDMESLIHQRMINQSRAVSVVSDALRRARAGVRNQSRPIGTFLFLGPTGVGKTELAKSLAAVYFGGEDHLVRVDLNEFSQPQDVTRLIAPGSENEHSLAASIMAQPFSVVLLDEIEKASPQVLSALLQVLDEGTLRDSTGREVSFRDAIIVATSNAGADEIRRRIEAGDKIEQLEESIVSSLISSHEFRPEFINRFDEIVVFRPLTPDELLQVVDLIVAGLNKTLAYQKVTVVVDDAAKRKLVEMGYDPRLGARPLRRVVQRTVESLTARKILEGTLGAGQTLTITSDDVVAPQ